MIRFISLLSSSSLFEWVISLVSYALTKLSFLCLPSQHEGNNVDKVFDS